MYNTSLLTFTIGMIAVLNPIGNTAIYISMTSHHKPRDQKRNAINCGIAILVILLISTWIGEPILRVFGISIGAFGSAGGIIVLLIAINMVRGQPHRPGYHTHVEERTTKNKIKHHVAIVPMAIPIIAGPGAISTIISHSYLFPSIQDRLIESAVLFCISAGIGLILFIAPLISKLLGEYGMKVATRVMGLILAAIAMQMLSSGLTKIFPGLG
jgi:multiple antibiotic resistance protein